MPDITNRLRLWLWRALPLLVAVSLAAATDATAQQTVSMDRLEAHHTLVIRDGTVWLDGEALSADELPSGLDLRGVEMHLQLRGDGRAAFELNGMRYALAEGRLVPVEQLPQQAEVSVFFRQGGDAFAAKEAVRPEQSRASSRSTNGVSSDGAGYVSGSVSDDVLRQTRALEAQVQELVASDIERLRSEQLQQQMVALQRQAASMVEAASRLAQAEVQGYFDVLRRQDGALFQQIQHEWSLEASTFQLANEIRHTRDPDRRVRLNEELRLRLDRIFELKQENRHREIEQLERELATMQERLTERERLREQIVQRRMQELTGQDEQ